MNKSPPLVGMSMAAKCDEEQLLVSLLKRNGELAASEEADATIPDVNRGETVTNVLLSMLDGEVHRLKTVEKSQLEGIERKDRDNKRMAVMLSMSRTQIEQLTARNEKLHADLTDKEAECRREAERAERLEAEVQALRSDKEAMRLLQTENETTAVGSLSKLGLEVESLKRSVKAAEENAQEAMLKRREDADFAVAESRKAFELRVALEARIKSLEEELGFINDLRARETKAATSKEYDLAIKVRQQGLEITDLSGRLETQTRSAFQLQAALKTENSALEARASRLERALQESERGALEASTRSAFRIKHLEEEYESLLHSSRAREAVLMQETAKLTSDLLSLQTQLTAEEDRVITQGRDATTRQVELIAAKNATEQRLAQCLVEIDHLKNKLDSQEVAAHAVAQDHARALSNQERITSTTLTGLRCDLDAAKNELKWKTDGIEKAEARVEELTALVTQLKSEYAAEVSKHKTEIAGYQHAVQVLDTHIQENTENKILVEKLRLFEDQIEHLKNQLASSNSAIANVRVESDIADSYRVELLRDQIDAESHRRGALERERQGARQLLEVLIPFYNEHQVRVVGSTGVGDTAQVANSPTSSRALVVNASPAAAAVEERRKRILSEVRRKQGSSAVAVGGKSTDEGAEQLLDVASAAHAINAFYRTYGGP